MPVLRLPRQGPDTTAAVFFPDYRWQRKAPAFRHGEYQRFTFNRSIVPLSSLTLLFSDVITETWPPADAGDRVTFEMPITPWV